MAEAPRLRLGSIAPDFEAETTAGPIKFHEWLGNSWGVLFSHPGDFTPVCTTELGEVARRTPDFEKRGVKVIGISANDLSDHHKWVQDINDYGSKVAPTDVQFPIVSSLFDYTLPSCYSFVRQQNRSPILIAKSRLCTTCSTVSTRPTAMQRACRSL